MAITITDYLKIDKDKFDELGAFDSFLDINSKLFVSPMLLKCKCQYKNVCKD